MPFILFLLCFGAFLGVMIFLASRWKKSLDQTLRKRLVPVKAKIVQLNARADFLARPVTLVQFEWEGKMIPGAIMNAIPPSTVVGDVLTVHVHPGMAKKKWPELFYMSEFLVPEIPS